MEDIHIEMNFCRRCGTSLRPYRGKHVFRCEKGHDIYHNASPTVGVVIFNDKDEVLVLERAVEPGKGMLDSPGGFCDGAETLEQAVARELAEEIGLLPADYSKPEFILSAVDPYPFDGEVVVNIGAMFKARMLTNKTPLAADDAATAKFVPLKNLNLNKIYFPAVRAAYAQLQKEVLS